MPAGVRGREIGGNAVATIAELQTRMRELQGSSEELDTEKRALAARIAQLAEAHGYAESAQASAQRLRPAVKALTPEASWQGARRTALGAAADGWLADEARGYADSVGDLVFSIKQQMRDLKVQLDYKRHALELIDDQMSSARTEFERLSAGATE